MDDLRVKYRYTLKMPDAEDNIVSLLSKLSGRHTDNILEGKEQLLISPILTRNASTFIQPIFDFDGRRGGGVLKAHDDARILAEKLSKYPFIYELTNDGVHLVFLIALYGMEVKPFRDVLKKLLTRTYKTIDLSATIKDSPIYRMGSYRETYTMAPFTDINLEAFKSVKNKKPIDIYPMEKWLEIWQTYLFPRTLTSSRSFLDRLS